MKCYNCGIELTDLTNHGEHIPAKNIFATLPTEYKLQLLKVPACLPCNNSYSKIDQEIRDAIGILNDKNDLLNELTKKSVASIMRRKNWKDRVIIGENGTEIEVSFSYNEFKTLHIKNFKGLFYSKYGFPISPEYKIDIISEYEEGLNIQKIADSMYEYINYENDSWPYIGHEEVFKYKLKAMVDGKDGLFYDKEDITGAVGFVCALNYFDQIKSLVMAFKPGYFSVKENN